MPILFKYTRSTVMARIMNKQHESPSLPLNSSTPPHRMQNSPNERGTQITFEQTRMEGDTIDLTKLNVIVLDAIVTVLERAAGFGVQEEKPTHGRHNE